MGRILILRALSAAAFDAETGTVGRPQEMSQTQLQSYLATIAPLYRAAFRGAPWFELSRCAPGCPHGEYCSAEPGTWCETAERESGLEEAHPVDEIVENFGQLLDESEALVVVEFDGDPAQEPTAQLGAVFWITTAEELWKRRYERVPEMLPWLVQEFGDRKFVYRDEVFGNVNRAGNLRYYHRLCRAAADSLGETLLVGRTINGAVMNVLCRRFPNAVRVLAPASYRVRKNAGVPVRCCPHVEPVVPDDRYIVVVDLAKSSTADSKA